MINRKLSLSMLILLSTFVAVFSEGRLGDVASELTGLKWVKNGPVELKKGNVYVLEFWATWCGPCIGGIPHLTSLQKMYKDRGVIIIGISQEGLDKVEPFVEKKGAQMDYSVAVDHEKKVYNSYMKKFKQNGIPHAFIVDKQGKVVWRGHPMKMDSALEKVVSGNYSVEEFSKQYEQLQREREEYLRKVKQEAKDRAEKVKEVSAEIEKKPNDAALYLKRAEAHLGRSFSDKVSSSNVDIIKALKDFEKAMELDPTSKLAEENIAFLKAWLKRGDDGYAALKQFVEKYPDSTRRPFALFKLNYFAFKAGKYDEALKYIRQAEKANLTGDFAKKVKDTKLSQEQKIKQ